MRPQILKFISLAKEKLGINAYYMPDGDIYVVTKNGKAVQNFTSDQFYQIPWRFRLNEWRSIIKVGLVQNMGEKTVVNQIHQKLALGKKIC